jgi:hypothetical protein
MFSTLPPQREKKMWCPRKLTFLAPHHQKHCRDNENDDDHLGLSRWKHIDLSLILAMVQSTHARTIHIFEMLQNGIFAMFAGSDKHDRPQWELTVN